MANYPIAQMRAGGRLTIGVGYGGLDPSSPSRAPTHLPSRDARFSQLGDHVRATGFTPLHDPVVVVATRDGAVLHTIVATEFARPSGVGAVLAFGVEADGDDWSPAIVGTPGDRSALTVGLGGVVQTVKRPGTVSAACGQLECFICDVLCGGLCGLGCGVACIVICGNSGARAFAERPRRRAPYRVHCAWLLLLALAD